MHGQVIQCYHKCYSIYNTYFVLRFSVWDLFLCLQTLIHWDKFVYLTKCHSSKSNHSFCFLSAFWRPIRGLLLYWGWAEDKHSTSSCWRLISCSEFCFSKQPFYSVWKQQSCRPFRQWQSEVKSRIIDPDSERICLFLLLFVGRLWLHCLLLAVKGHRKSI